MSIWRKEIDKNIRLHGRFVFSVFAAEDIYADWPFSYSVGNTLKGLPELLVLGLIDNWTINVLSELMIDRGGPFTDSEIVSLGGPRPVKLYHAADEVKDLYTIQAGQYFGARPYSVMQVIVPDREGRFAGDPGCDRPYCEVPIFRKCSA